MLDEKQDVVAECLNILKKDMELTQECYDIAKKVYDLGYATNVTSIAKCLLMYEDAVIAEMLGRMDKANGSPKALKQCAQTLIQKLDAIDSIKTWCEAQPKDGCDRCH